MQRIKVVGAGAEIKGHPVSPNTLVRLSDTDIVDCLRRNIMFVLIDEGDIAYENTPVYDVHKKYKGS